MAPSLRGRLVCFYCGSRSAQIRKPNLSSWQCEKCEALNHLDENGEITDPPASGDYTNARYAQSIQRPTSPVFDRPDESLFCQTCLKNQHVFAETLAAYFPSQDAPNYGDFERAYPAYRKGLEERYPQVCEQCAPRVQERIRATGYAAKTDHLRRMMERTRGHGVPREGFCWKRALAFIGGTAWFASLVGQVAWDALVLSMSGKEVEGLVDENISLSVCVQQAMRGSDLGPGCMTLATPMARFALLLGFLAFWWNPKLQEISRRGGGRMVGVSEYYKQQALLLLVRLLGFFYLERIPSWDIYQQKTLGIHAFLVFFCALLTVMSFRTIGIDYTPRVVFQDSPEPLIPRQPLPGTTTTGSNISLRQPTSYTALGTSGARPFSINDLAPASRQQHSTSYQPPYQPPTPPPDDDDDDEAMDWTPSQQPSLRPATVYRPSAIQHPQQNPFRGHLPADVVSQAHRLRNPPNKPTFRKASETSKQNFFRTPKRNVRDLDSASDAGTEYEPSLADDQYSVEPRFANPKMHLQSSQTPVTGLERLLASAFSLSDEPGQVQTAQQQQAEARNNDQILKSSGYAQWHRLPVLILLTVSYFFWTSTLKPSLAVYEAQFRLTTLFLAASISIRSLFLSLRKDMAVWSGSDILVFTIQFVASMALTLTIGDASKESLPTASHRTQQTAGSSLLAILAVQELWLFIQDMRTALGPSQPNPAQTPAPDSSLSPTLPIPQVQHSTPRAHDTTPRQPTNAIVQPRTDHPYSTRTRKGMENTRSPATGFGGLSLGESNRNVEFGGMDSPSVVQARRRNRDGMW